MPIYLPMGSTIFRFILQPKPLRNSIITRGWVDVADTLLLPFKQKFREKREVYYRFEAK